MQACRLRRTPVLDFKKINLNCSHSLNLAYLPHFNTFVLLLNFLTLGRKWRIFLLKVRKTFIMQIRNLFCTLHDPGSCATWTHWTDTETGKPQVLAEGHPPGTGSLFHVLRSLTAMVRMKIHILHSSFLLFFLQITWQSLFMKYT